MNFFMFFYIKKPSCLIVTVVHLTGVSWGVTFQIVQVLERATRLNSQLCALGSTAHTSMGRAFLLPPDVSSETKTQL